MAIDWGAAAKGVGSWLGNNAGSLLQLGTALYGANQQGKAYEGAARAATPTAYSTGSMYGTTTVDPRSRTVQYGMGTNPFAQLLNMGGMQSFANAFSAPGAAYGGAAPEVAAAAEQMYGPGMQAEADARLAQLRQLAAPEEQRAQQSLAERQFATGRTGTSGGGIQQEAFARAMSQADLQRQLASQDWAQNRSMGRFNTALQAVQGGQQGAINQFTMGQQSLGGLNDLFRMLLAQGNQGIGAGAGTPSDVALASAGASQLPLQAGIDWAKNAGVFDALGGWLGGKGSSIPTGWDSPTIWNEKLPMQPHVQPQPGPWAGGYQFPT